MKYKYTDAYTYTEAHITYDACTDMHTCVCAETPLYMRAIPQTEAVKFEGC